MEDDEEDVDDQNVGNASFKNEEVKVKDEEDEEEDNGVPIHESMEQTFVEDPQEAARLEEESDSDEERDRNSVNVNVINIWKLLLVLLALDQLESNNYYVS